MKLFPCEQSAKLLRGCTLGANALPSKMIRQARFLSGLLLADLQDA